MKGQVTFPPPMLISASEAMVLIASGTYAGPVSSKLLADKLKLPPRYLEGMLQRLVKAGLLRSTRGPSGGYMLNRKPENINLASVYDVVLKWQPLPPLDTATAFARRALTPVWANVRDQMHYQLELVTLADVVRQGRLIP